MGFVVNAELRPIRPENKLLRRMKTNEMFQIFSGTCGGISVDVGFTIRKQRGKG